VEAEPSASRNDAEQSFDTGESASAVDQEHIHPERGHSYWTYTVWPIPDDQGRPTGLVLLVTDTTDHHRDEQDVVDRRAGCPPGLGRT
jgi:hypothetical protein